MANLEHKNLFAHGDKAAVYEALQRDYNGDSWVQYFWSVVFVGSALGAVYLAHHPDWFWLFLGLYAVERQVARYGDNSNRNWAMHVIDWIESNREQDAI